MVTEKTMAFPLHLLLISTIFSILNNNLITASDTISKGQSLTGNQTLISKDGRFELGFFKPSNKSLNYYIGIWYKSIPGQTVFWVANRETPVSSPSTARLTVTDTGDLALFGNRSSKTPVWSTNSTSSSAAVLLDTGNLVLVNGSNSDSYIWQSFDHPTDTWMPGGWLGANKMTGEYQSLTSWKNPEDPAPGLFAETMAPDGSNQFVMIWNQSIPYWSSGLWNGEYFGDVPSTKERSQPFNFSFIDNKDRKYATYTMVDSSVLSRCVADANGQLQQWYWLTDIQKWQSIFTKPILQCDVYSLCGPFGVCSERGSPVCQCAEGFQPANNRDWELSDWSLGCSRKSRLQCGNGDGFLEMSNVRLPVNPENLMVNTQKDCEAACMKNCSCSAYSYNSTGCSIWKGGLRHLQQLRDGDNGGGSLFLRLLATDIPSSGGSSNSSTVAVVLGAVFGAVAVLCLAFGLAFLYKRKKTRASKLMEGSLLQFSYSELQRMTKNFSETLGRGGFGPVYKGTLQDSTPLAVKKLEGLRQGEKQFRTEVITLGSIQHVNLVRLRGFCIQGSERLLVYDYMKEGSLDSRLFREGPTFLNWKTRYQIILGAARGLAYLHEKCRECIIHCDVKPDNILLDEAFRAKVSDFGMAKLIGRDFSRVLTTMRGTVGYLAPEWLSGLPVTPKVDVYSFGMMLFEIVSGKRNLLHAQEGDLSFFPLWAARKIAEGDEVSLLDQRLDGSVDFEELSRVCKAAVWCIQDLEDHRPTMGQIVQILEGVVEVKTAPIPDGLLKFATEEAVRFWQSDQLENSVSGSKVSIE